MGAATLTHRTKRLRIGVNNSVFPMLHPQESRTALENLTPRVLGSVEIKNLAAGQMLGIEEIETCTPPSTDARDKMTISFPSVQLNNLQSV